MSHSSSPYDETAVKNMIKEGKDPKDLLIQVCRPQCQFWEDKLKRCENALSTLGSADPEKSCMYPMRDYVTCVEGCVQPKIFKHLAGAQGGRFFY